MLQVSAERETHLANVRRARQREAAREQRRRALGQGVNSEKRLLLSDMRLRVLASAVPDETCVCRLF